MDTRGSSSSRGYGSKWQQARKRFLASHPLCVMCEKQGIVTPATVVDHIEPHRGDQSKFWKESNWQALCKPCHDRHKQRIEKSGYEVGCDASGIPLSAGHHWNKG